MTARNIRSLDVIVDPVFTASTEETAFDPYGEGETLPETEETAYSEDIAAQAGQTVPEAPVGGEVPPMTYPICAAILVAAAAASFAFAFGGRRKKAAGKKPE